MADKWSMRSRIGSLLVALTVVSMRRRRRRRLLLSSA
jgi:hypothetical protein